MKMKTILTAVATLGLAAACAAPQPLAKVGPLHLDTAASSVVAVAVKNGKVEVPVTFSGLQGFAQADGKVEIRIPVGSMSTGNDVRDGNVKKFFFELDKVADFATAVFTLQSLDADVSGLKDGQTLSAGAKGSLSLHGAAVDLAGPLTFSRKGKTLTVTLGEGWAVLIDKTSLVEPLKNLNKNCPQPHVVGNEVKLKGTLVFKA
jgi:polyisoprenoid-binding protein YceI